MEHHYPNTLSYILIILNSSQTSLSLHHPDWLKLVSGHHAQSYVHNAGIFVCFVGVYVFHACSMRHNITPYYTTESRANILLYFMERIWTPVISY